MSVPLHRQSEYGGVVFGGWARMAQTITSFSIVEVAKPNIGESWPARVRADVTVNLNVQNHIKHEWEGGNPHIHYDYYTSLLFSSFILPCYTFCLLYCVFKESSVPTAVYNLHKVVPLTFIPLGLES